MGATDVRLHLTAPTLQTVRVLDADVLVLHHFVEERPLRGLAGVVDWQVGGRLSRLVVRGLASGALHDNVLMPGGSGLRVRRVLLMGLGNQRAYSPDRLRLVTLHTLDVLGRLHADSFAWAIPGLSVLRIGARRAVEVMLTALHQVYVAADEAEARAAVSVSFVVPEACWPEVVEPVEAFERRYGEGSGRATIRERTRRPTAR